MAEKTDFNVSTGDYQQIARSICSVLDQPGIQQRMKLNIEKMENIAQCEINEKHFSLDKNERVSLYTICEKFCVRPDGESEGEGRVVFDIKEGPELYLHVGCHFLRVGLDFSFLWTYKETVQPVSILSYEQNEAGILAWVAEVSYECRTGLVSARFPIIKTNGVYEINRMLLNLPPEVSLSIERCNLTHLSGENI